MNYYTFIKMTGQYIFDTPESFKDAYEDMVLKMDKGEKIEGEWKHDNQKFYYNLRETTLNDCVYKLEKDFDALYSTLKGSHLTQEIININVNGRPIQFEYNPLR